MQSGTSTLNGQVPTTGLSVTEAAQVLGISPNTVRARIKAGRLRAQRVQRPQGDVIGVFLGSEDLPTSGTSAGTSHQVPTGTYNASNHAPAIASQREALALALVPLVEAAVAPLGTELAEVRALLSARDQELGHLRAQFEALQDDRLEIALGRDSEGIAVEPTQNTVRGAQWSALVALLGDTLLSPASKVAQRTMHRVVGRVPIAR